MSTEPLIIESPGTADACVIWLHGLGADRYDFVPVVRALELSADHGVRFIFPQAPTRPVTINGGFPMPSWFDILAISPQRVMNEEQLDESVAMVRGLVEQQMAEGIQPERIVLAGFSQGGAIVMRAAIDSELPLAGVMSLSTYGPTLERALAAHQGPKLDVFFAHGDYDDILQPALGRHAQDLLQAAGHHTRWHAYPMAHEVCPQEIADIRSWLADRLGLR
ncbi:alpha/beta hydrolase [Halopseudomonas pertucinogena]|uniref:Carboxylesterase n=1 Tax=Halopseudomonas pertucinogena TaxID=86175 RepID=A0ABQ2CGW4_9GAMM|nr:alpha/beta fold hydrolase [Halopseudomonas pertucinogena]GGI88631.1 carboxylesterase [Halopseudomonas pertucinogena]